MTQLCWHERCEVWWLRWNAAVKVGLSLTIFCALFIWMLAGVFILDDYTEADLNRMAIDSLRQDVQLQRLTEQKDALMNTLAALERLNLQLVVIDSAGQIKPIRRMR
jgi:hypothetical protein